MWRPLRTRSGCYHSEMTCGPGNSTEVLAARFPGVPEVLREPLARWWERAAGLPALLTAYGALPDALRGELRALPPAANSRPQF